MTFDRPPALLLRAALRRAPAPLIQKAIDALLGTMRDGHPMLFKNLKRLPAAAVLIAPSDLAHRFKLSYGKKGVSLVVLEDDEDFDFDARIKGSLEGLLNLLEGRADGDKLFFSRDLEISGDTAVIVALRNTLDREEMNLLEDMTAPLGPFAKPAQLATGFLESVARHARDRIAEISEENMKIIAKDMARAETAKLREEIQELKARLAKIEGQRKRAR